MTSVPNLPHLYVFDPAQVKHVTTQKQQHVAGYEVPAQAIQCGHSQGSSRGDSKQHDASVVYNQVLVPRYRWRDAILSLEFLSQEEQQLRCRQVLDDTPKGERVVHTEEL